MGRVKRFVAALLTVVLLVTMLPFAQTEVYAAKKMKLNKKKITLTVGKKKRLRVKHKPKGVKVKWRSKNKKIARVSKKGVVRAKRPGKATIIAKIGKKKLKCRVRVKAKKKPSVKKPGGSSANNSKIPTTTKPGSGSNTPDNYTSEVKNDIGEYNHTPKKGEKIVFDLNIEITPVTGVKSVIVGGKSYPAEHVSENHYRVSIPAPATSGKQELLITGIILDNGKQIQAEYKAAIDVLKEQPKINDLFIDTEKEIPEVSFEISDTDGAWKSGKLTLSDEKGTVVFESDEVHRGKNTFPLKDLIKDKNYTVKVAVDYDLDSDIFGVPEDYRGTIEESKQFKVDAQYGFEGENWNLTKQVKAEDALLLTFENAYDSYYNVKFITVSGKRYEVAKNDNTYQIELEKGAKGANKVNVENVILENGKEYAVNQELDYVYLKDVPAFGEKIDTERTESKLKVTFDIQDTDSALVRVHTVLTDEQGNFVDEKEMEPGSNQVEFHISESGSYKVKAEYVYDLGDGSEVTKTKQYGEIIKEPIKVNITDCQIVNNDGEKVYYVEKNQKLNVIYTIQTNTKEQISYITVNSVKLPVKKNEADGSYTVSFNAPQETGKTDIEVTRVEFEESGDVETSNVSEIEVLKSAAPVVNGISFIKTDEKPLMAFVVKDEEDTFVNGKISITNSNKEKIQEITFDSIADTAFELDKNKIENFEKYNVEINVSYDLDSDKKDDKNKKNVIATDTFEFVGDFNFTLSSFKLQNVDTKNNKIVLAFEGSIAEQAQDTYQISKAIISGTTYDVTSQGKDAYTVEIPYTDETRQELELQEVILNSSQGFPVTGKKVTVFKTHPNATVRSTVLRTAPEEWLKNITAYVKVYDPDSTIHQGELHARLLNPDNQEIAQLTKIVDAEDLHEKEAELDFAVEQPYSSGTYTVEVYADYDRSDGIIYDDTTIGTAKVSVSKYADIEKSQAKQYVEKGEGFDITYTINSNTDETVEGIIINEKTYTPDKIDDNTYRVHLTAPEEAGKVQYHATRLVYHDSQISATNTTNVDVLKNIKPKVEGLVVNKENPEKPVLSFDILDEENTFVSGQIIVTDGTGSETSYSITDKDDTTVELKDIEQGKEYSVKVKLTYDLDSNHQDTANQKTEIFAENSFEIDEQYDVSVSDYKLDKIDTQRKVIIVKFTSTNTSKKYDIQSVMIAGNEYSIKDKNENEYTVEIPYTDSTRQELELQKVIFSDLKGFSDFEVEKLVVFREKPSAEVQAQVAADMKEIKATVSVTDNESLLKSLSVQLLNEEGKLLDTKQITIKELRNYLEETVFYPQEETLFEEGTYQIKLLGDYDAADGDSYEEKELAEESAEVGIVTEVSEAKPEKYYVEKNDSIKINYTIQDNTKRTIQNMMINGHVVTPEKISDGKYAVTIDAPENHTGPLECTLTEVTYQGEVSVSVTNTTNVELLKSKKPVVDNLAVNCDGDKPKLSFAVTDEENTFVSGKFVIEDKGGQAIHEPTTFDSLEDLSFELDNIVEFREYIVKIYLTYDFDSDKNNEKNQKEELFKEHTFEVGKNFDFSLSDLRVKDITDTNIILEFESTLTEEAEDTYYLDTVVINGQSYKVKKQDGDLYSVEIPYTERKRTELKLEKAILNNLHEFTDVNKSIVVFKSVSAVAIPTVSADAKSISVDVNVIDEDKIAKNIYAVLKNEQGEAARKSIQNAGQSTVVFENQNIFDAGKYTVEIVASYDAVDGKTHKNEILTTGKTNVAILAEVKEASYSPYAQKGKEIAVTYHLKTNAVTNVETIVVNNVPYEAVPAEEDTYKVNVVAPDSAGTKELTVSRINFENEESVEVQYTSSVEVLKSIVPVVSDVTINDTQATPVLSFTVTDEEDTFVSGKIIVKNAGSETGKVKEMSFSSITNTTFVLDGIKEFNPYDIDIEITYDFDSDKKDAEHQQTEVLAQKSFEIIKDYNFKLEEFKVKQIDRSNQKAILEFNSTNASGEKGYYVDTVTINGDTYKVTKLENNKYTVTVPYTAESRTELVLESATLNNLKQFKELEKRVVIFKDKPQMAVDVKVDESLSTITADIMLTDDDEALTDLNARLINPNGKLLNTKEIDNDATSVVFTSPENGIFKAGEYKVEIGADYDLADGRSHNEKETIGTGNVKIASKASITNAKIQKYYVEKGQNVEIEYTLSSNNENALSGININSVYYPATGTGNDTYTVVVPAASTGYGLNTIRPASVMYGEETVVLDKTEEAQYYLLKAAPTINNYAFHNNQKEQTITFDYHNSEKAIVKDAKVIVKQGDKEKISREIKEGTNTVELKTLENGDYTISVAGTYDLDDTEDEQNKYELSDLFKQKTIHVISQYMPTFEVKDVDVNKKEKRAVITFTSTNAAHSDVRYIIADDEKYEVTKQTEENTYTAEIPYTNDEYYKGTVTDIIIDGDIQLELPQSRTYEIFKTAPTVSDVQTTVEEDTITVQFHVNDAAGIMTNGKAILKDAEGNPVGSPQTVDKDTDYVTFQNVNQAGSYTVEIVADYDRVDGEIHEQQRIHSEEITVEINIKSSVNKAVASKLYAGKNEDITLTYTIQDNTNKKVSALIINDGTKDREYSVKDDGENSEVTVTTSDTYGQKIYTLKKIKYGDTTVEAEGTKTAVQVYVLKTAPAIKNYTLDLERDIPAITFQVDNPDKANIRAKALILDENKETVITSEENIQNGENVLELDGIRSNQIYHFVLEGTYDLDDEENGENEHNITTIFKGEQFQLNTRADITAVDIPNRYVQKNGNVDIICTVTSNTAIPLSYIVINGKRYAATSLEDGKYKVVYTAQEKSGVETLKISGLVYDENELAVEKTEQIEVLKQTPKTAKDYQIAYNYKDKSITVTFTVEDPEEAIQNQKVFAVLRDTESNTDSAQLEAAAKGKQSVTFKNVKVGVLYKVVVTADYDLDTNALNDITEKDDNLSVGAKIFETEAKLLKKIPDVSGFKVDTSGAQPTASFDMSDDDDSFAGGNIVITNKETGDITNVPLVKNKTDYPLDLQPFVKYKVELKISYDLDEDSQNNENQGEKLFGTVDDVEFIGDYHLSVSDFIVKSVNIEEQKAVLQFKSTNVSKYGVVQVNVEKKKYSAQMVEGEKDTYTFEYSITPEQVDHRTEITIDSVILANGDEVELSDTVKTTIFRKAPVVTDINLQGAENQIHVKFDVTDEENTLTKLYAVLQDETGNKIQEKEFGADRREVSFDGVTAGKYMVEIQGDYELADGKKHIQTSLKKSDILTISPVVQMKTNSISKKYPAKGETIAISYNIRSNTGLDVSKVVIKGIEYSVTKESEDNYNVAYKAPETAGYDDIKVTKVIFTNDEFADLSENPHTDEIDVLKTVPDITGFSSSDDLGKEMVMFTFEITDPDDAMVSGKATVGGQEQTIHKGPNSIFFIVEPDVEHTLSIEVEYDLDTNRLAGEDENTNKSTFRKEQTFTLLSNYELNISNLKTFKNETNEETKYFAKNEPIQLRFDCTNKTELVPSEVRVHDLEDKSGEGEWFTVHTAEKEDGSVDYYYVEIKGKNEPGAEKIEISDVKLNSGKVVSREQFKGSVPFADIEILKDKPEISGLSVTNNESSVTLFFNVTDNDNALLDSFIRVYDNEDNREVFKTKIRTGENDYTISLTPGKKYTLNIEKNYNLDSSVEDEFNSGREIAETRLIEIARKNEPNFVARNLSVPKRVPNGHKVELTFENKIMSYENVSTITINGTEHTVTKDANNVYHLELEPGKEGVHTIHVESVRMGEKTFRIDRNLTYTHEYIIPTIKTVDDEIREDAVNNQAIVNYQIDDPHNTIKSLTAYMRNSAGVVAATKKIEPGADTLSMSLIKSYRYLIDLKAEYDVGDGKTFETVNLFTKEKNAEARVTIVDESINKEFADKGEDVVITYKINTNFDQDLRKVFIGDTSYSTTKLKEADTYEITVPAPKAAGIFKQEVTQMQVGNNNYKVEDPNPVAIKVFRNKPTLTHFIVDENKNQLSFKINDADEAFTEDAILTVSDDSGNVATKLLTEGDAVYTFALNDIGMTQINRNYHIVVHATYDLKPERDANVNSVQNIMSLSGLNEVQTGEGETPDGEEIEDETSASEDIYERDVTLSGLEDYKFYFEDSGGFYIFSMNTDKNDMEVNFKSTNISDYKPAKIIIDGKEYSVAEGKTANKYKVLNYRPGSYDQEFLNYEKVILENGASFDIPCAVPIMVLREDPKFYLTDVEEDIEEQKIRFTFNLDDRDGKVVSDLKFVLRDSQNQIIDTKYVSVKDKMVEFNIPNPPTAKYKLSVYGDLFIFEGWNDKDQLLFSGEYDSKVNTSILNSEFSTRYPKKGQTITIDYTISSTKVVLIDPDDHDNLSKAINITNLVINGKEYDVEHLGGEKYRIYYPVQEDEGIEEINVSQINFSNDTIEEFHRNDKIEVLKDIPTVSNYKTENHIEDNKVVFTFDISDPDDVLDANPVYALVNGERKDLHVGENSVEYTVSLDELSQFEIKATYDLDTDQLSDENGDANSYTDETIFKKPFLLTGNYDVAFNDIKTFNTSGKETGYFEKNEDVGVSFDFEAKGSLYPESIVIDDVEYPLEKNEQTGRYSVRIKGSKNAGLVNAKINSVTLNSGNKVELNDEKISYEVLKDVVKVEQMEYYFDTNNQDIIHLETKISDVDQSGRKLWIAVKDEYGLELSVSEDTLKVGTNNITFNKTSADKYFVSVYSTYDRDCDSTDNINYFENSKIYKEVVTINNRYIEMKDVVDVQLYRYSDTGSVEKVESLSVNNLDVLENCLVKVTMRDIPQFFSRITDYEEENGKLKLVLDYGDAMIYNGRELKPLEVTLDILEDENFGYDGSFGALLDKMREKPDGSFTLDKDYDLEDFPANLDDSEAIINFDFTGHLDGNGRTIRNLHKPLFKTLRKATVENLVFKGITYLKPQDKSVVTKYGYGATISNVHIDGVGFASGDGKSNNATFAYQLRDGSVVENSSAVNINFAGYYLSQVNAGGVSYLYDSIIRNCYVQGKIMSGWHFNGGLVGITDNKSQITNNIINMSVTPYYGFGEGGNGGVVSNSNGVTLKNNLSLVSSGGNISTFYSPRSTISEQSENNYHLKDTTSYKSEGNGIKEISKEDINKSFFESLQFDKQIWNLENTSFDNLPTLKGDTVSFNDDGYKPDNSRVYIPDYNRIYHLPDYHPEKEVIYHNMYKLMPFYDAKEILTDGNKIKEDHFLNQKIIDYVLPYDKNGKLVSVLTTENYNSLAKISMVFEDGTEKEYEIDFDDYYGNVASYMIPDLNIGYNYSRFIIDKDAEIIKELIDEASKYDYTKDLDPITSGEDSRLYKEFYNEVTKRELEDFVEKMLVNCGYIPTFENDVLDNLIRQNIVENGKLKQMLYAYNYFKYWYDLDMDGVDVGESIMFHGDEMFDNRMTLLNLSEELVQGSNSATNVTGGFYNNYISRYTTIDNLGDFIDSYVTSLTDYKTGEDWFKANWHGGFYEAVPINNPKAYYTFWDHFKRSGNTQNSFLPLFSVPENSMYVITSPTQVFYGSLRIYVQNPDNPEEMKKFKEEKISNFTMQLRNFYQFASDYVGEEYLNPFVDQQYDMRTTLTSTGTVFNNPRTTQEPYHKYFAEALNKWPSPNGTGAYATGSEVFWTAIKLINGFNVATHETLHNQDSKIFLMGNGRRGVPEDYTAGNLQQYYNDGWFSPNVMIDWPDTQEITQNFTYERVNTDKKMKDFYEKYFELNDFLDYIEAKAFFKLNDEEKAKVAVQVSYPKLANESKEVQEKGDSQVAYEPLTVDKVKGMNLNSMNDLWDNHIMLKPNVKKTTIQSPGAATDSIYNIHWYQPHADDDRADGPSFKWLAWELTGTGGYYDGYMAYFSQSYIGKKTGKNDLKTTDLIALRYITQDENITFKKYKMDRYDRLEKHWNDEGTYIDAQEIYEEYLKALTNDAARGDRKLTQSTAVKKKYFLKIKKETRDLRVSAFDKKTDAPQEETTE